ncbi:MAG: sulfatase-like hydrolase/transferase [Deltaproteobacteria bacterium]|nr:sulfatase-like hydrolase/transferase [Deltaproteobacteria bacterium]
MTRLWMMRILKGAGAAALLGAVLGGFETAVVLRTSVTEIVNALDRLLLWLVNAGSAAAVAGAVGTALAAGVGSVAGLSSEDRSLALQTGRDPTGGWLPLVLGGTFFVTLFTLVTPGLFRAGVTQGGPARVGLVLLLVLVFSVAFTLAMRLLLKRLDVTGRGQGLALLGLPALVLVSMSFAVSAPMLGGRGTQTKVREGTPNLLLITVDGLRADHVGAGSRVRTPTLQWMARKGITFSQATTPSTSEGPPLGAVHTGRHPLVTGFVADGQSLPASLPGSGADLQTLAEKLQSEGYSTGAFVSSAALDGRATGLSRGFTVYDDGVGTGRRGSDRLALKTMWRWITGAGKGPDPEEVLRSASESVSRLGEWMSWHHGENQFAWLHLSEPRNRLLGFDPDPADLVDPIPGEAGRAYGARVVGLDEVIGDLLQGLEADGMLDDWLFVVVGTRGRVPGGAFPNVGDPWSQVPMIVFGAGVPEGVRVDTQVRLEDVPATALTAMGFVKRRFGDGYSLMALAGGTDLGALQALVVAPPRAEDGRCGIAVREGRWKFARDEKGNGSLYDLKNDSKEVDDVQEKHAERAEAAKSHLRELLGKPNPEVTMPALDPERAAVLKALRDL